MIVKMGEQILMIDDALYEDDAFEYFDEWTEIILNKDTKISGPTTTSTRKTASIYN